MIHNELILIDYDFLDKADVFQRIANKAATLNLISDKRVFTDALIRRESEFPTSIGHGVGIPHCRSETVVMPFISFIRCASPIMWDPQGDESVSMIFLIAIPETNENNLHLKMLSTISRKLMHESFRLVLSESKSVSEVRVILSDLNLNIEKGE